MSVTAVTSMEQLRDLTNAPGIKVIDFWAPWCAPCKVFGPIFEKVSNLYPDIRFLSVDTESNNEIAVTLGIQAIPTVMVFRDTFMVYQNPGALPENAVVKLIEATQKLDMDEVKRMYEEQTMGFPILFRGLGKGSFTSIRIFVSHIAEYARGSDGTCALCHGDPLDEKKEDSLIHRFYSENPDAGTCPVCTGRPT